MTAHQITVGEVCSGLFRTRIVHVGIHTRDVERAFRYLKGIFRFGDTIVFGQITARRREGYGIGHFPHIGDRPRSNGGATDFSRHKTAHHRHIGQGVRGAIIYPRAAIGCHGDFHRIHLQHAMNRISLFE